jgi:hypothetical protein
MKIDEALKTIPLADQRRVRANLRRLSTRSAVAYQAVLNFHSETRFTQEGWTTTFAGLRDGSDPDGCRQSVSRTFRVLTLRGPEVSLGLTCKLGRAVTLQRLCRLLCKLNYFATVSSARRAVRNMLSQPVTILTKRWKNYQLGIYLMWSTFNPDAAERSPFENMPNSAEGIRGLLGLDRNESELPLILFEYILPRDTVARFPTLAEAYAGEEWPYFFRPAPVGAPYGMTMPWPELEKSEPRPELVHAVLAGASLMAPLREVL